MIKIKNGMNTEDTLNQLENVVFNMSEILDISVKDTVTILQDGLDMFYRNKTPRYINELLFELMDRLENPQDY